MRATGWQFAQQPPPQAEAGAGWTASDALLAASHAFYQVHGGIQLDAGCDHPAVASLQSPPTYWPHDESGLWPVKP